MKGPEQRQQLDQQVDHEPAVVPLPDAVLDPGAVMVEAPHAVFARLTVLRSHWLLLRTHTGRQTRHFINHAVTPLGRQKQTLTFSHSVTLQPK